MNQLFIIVLFICMFLCGMATGLIIGHQPTMNAIAECEKSLPRNQTCKVIIQAVPNEVLPEVKP